MDSAEFNLERNLLVSAERDSDIVQFLTKLAEKKGINAAAFTAIGALKRAKLGFYDEGKHEYREIAVDSPQELASCTGNISIKNGKPFVHVHAVLADKDGNTKAGHLFEGIVFAAEIHLRELKGPKLERKYSETTKLSLWDIK
ncbi:MAG: DNA-binding protein [Candidatus Bathyarchaeota archaeon]|nr:MAG: DNA-binding protein [Candidatus Bathyarchaeota archaeon]